MKKETIKSYAVISLGCVLYAFAFDWFYAPNDLTCGGLTGVSQIIHYFIRVLPIGAMLIVMNAPLFFLGFRRFGAGFLMRSLYAMALSSALVDVLASLHAFRAMNELLAALYGGVLLGVGCGLIMREEANTGGTELAAWLLKRRVPQLSIGNLLLWLDLAVIVSHAAAFQNLNNALYGGVALFVETKVIDLIVYGGNAGKLAHIISEREAEITQALLARRVGVTRLRATGAYTGVERSLLLCAVRRQETVMVRRIVKEIDPDAFFILSDTVEVLGEGFGEYRPDGLT